jgi:hypothetical protein
LPIVKETAPIRRGWLLNARQQRLPQEEPRRQIDKRERGQSADDIFDPRHSTIVRYYLRADTKMENRKAAKMTDIDPAFLRSRAAHYRRQVDETENIELAKLLKKIAEAFNNEAVAREAHDQARFSLMLRPHR